MVGPMTPERCTEIAEKSARLVRLAEAAQLRGILLATQPNFSWVTGGLTNRIDGSRESGNGALLFTVDGGRYVVANTIENPRLATEALVGAGFESIEYGWTEERADPALPVRLSIDAAGGPIGSDMPLAGAVSLEQEISRLRAPLTRLELQRYRELGAAVGCTIGAVARAVDVGATEQDVAGLLISALAPLQIRPVVLLVAADDRIARYRHPTPTLARWTRRLMIATCAERDGLIVAASRLVHVGGPDAELTRRTRAAALTYATLLRATRAGATGARLFEAAVSGYAAAGFPGEERLHHQGGAIGYRPREWVAHPYSDDVVTPPQAFAWNPTVTGTKIEESCIVHQDGRIVALTSSPEWPGIEVDVNGQMVTVPDVLIRTN
jgi:Xaa-Pro aminopeptidase